MKRTLSVIISALFILAVITGCAGGSAASASGTYVLKSINGLSIQDAFAEQFGDEISLDDILSLLGLQSIDDYMKVELKSDGSAVVSVAGEEGELGTWKQDGNKVTITVDGDSVECTLNGNELTLPIEGETYVLVKK